MLTTSMHWILLQVGLDKETVRIWFGNRRQTEKKQEFSIDELKQLCEAPLVEGIMNHYTKRQKEEASVRSGSKANALVNRPRSYVRWKRGQRNERGRSTQDHTSNSPHVPRSCQPQTWVPPQATRLACWQTTGSAAPQPRTAACLLHSPACESSAPAAGESRPSSGGVGSGIWPF